MSCLKIVNICRISLGVAALSIVKHAYISASTRPGGTNLGLERIEMKIWCQGYYGLKIINLKNKLWYSKHLGEQPQFIVIHCEGNDLGSKENSLFFSYC